MSGGILLSIHGRHANRIFSGIKIREFRRSLIRASVGSLVYFYETKPVGMVTGLANLASVERVPRAEALNLEHDSKERDHLAKYLAGVDLVTVLGLDAPVRWSEPMPLRTFGLTRAPQSFRYLTLDGDLSWATSPY